MANGDSKPKFSLRGSLESKCCGLRNSEPPPTTYKKFQQMPDGSITFIGEFPVPEIKWPFTRSKKVK